MDEIWSIIEILFAAGLFTNAILFIPQIIRLVQKKHSDDISLITFLGFNIINLLTVLHGFLHKDYILLFGSFAAFLTNSVVTFLIIWYRLNRSTQK